MLNVLICETDQSLWPFMRAFLEGEGHRVKCVASAREAMQEVWSSTAMLITDLNLGTLSGYDLIAFMRGHWPEVAIIAMSGRDPSRPLPRGVVFLSKPFGLDELAEAIEIAHPHIHTACGCSG